MINYHSVYIPENHQTALPRKESFFCFAVFQFIFFVFRNLRKLKGLVLEYKEVLLFTTRESYATRKKPCTF